MDKGDWFYIVFLIISIVASLFGKKKKKSPTTPVRKPEKEIRLDDIFDQISQSVNEALGVDSEPEDTRMEPEFEEAGTHDSGFFTPEDNVYEPAPSKSVDFSVHDSARDKTGDIVNSEQEESDEIAYDLKEMVIHSTILNRPEF